MEGRGGGGEERKEGGNKMKRRERRKRSNSNINGCRKWDNDKSYGNKDELEEKDLKVS